jgi:hypothetical protein
MAPVSSSGREVFVCYHCGNRASHDKVGSFNSTELFEQVESRRLNERFRYDLYRCSTCDGISVFGDFVDYPERPDLASRRIHPKGSRLLPPAHLLANRGCVPQRILQLYDEIWPLRHVSPTAFAGQVRRALEFVCSDQKAAGRTLFEQLQDLAKRGTFPGYFVEMTDLMRRVGNLGSHAGEVDVDFWDAELLDDFFRSVIEYVYIAPSKIERLKERIKVARSGPQ